MNMVFFSKVCLSSPENFFFWGGRGGGGNFVINKNKYQRKFEDVHEKPEFRFQAFIQAVLLVSVFEQRLSFRLFCFMKNDREIILRCGWGFGGAVSSAAGS